MRTIADHNWPSAYTCPRCRRDGQRIRAVVRAFSGICADGFAGCDEHAIYAIERALRPLLGPRITTDYKVTVYTVDASRGFPELKLFWTARKRLATGGQAIPILPNPAKPNV